jgi:putative ABC transport system ATP-binding protein
VGPDRALVIVTHDARIFEFADRIAKMDDGRVVKVEDRLTSLSPRGEGRGEGGLTSGSRSESA